MKFASAVTVIATLIVAPRVSPTMLSSVTSERVIAPRNSRFRPLLSKFQDRLVCASFPAYPRPQIKLEFERSSEPPCELDFSTMDEIDYPLHFDALANGNKMILSFVGSADTATPLTRNRRYLLTHIIDLEACEYLQPSVTTVLPDNDDDEHSIVVALAGEDVFDVFLTGHPHCDAGKACRLRYSDRGVLIGASEFVVPDYSEDWSFDSVSEGNFSDGYFYSVITRDDTIVQRMEQDLKVQRELRIGHKMSFLYSATRASVNDCRGVTATDLECRLRDLDLQERSRAHVDLEYTRSFTRALRLFNLADGSALIFYVLQVFSEPWQAWQGADKAYTTYLQRVDLHGHADDPVRFQEDVCKDVTDVRMIRLRDDFYCFVVHCHEALHYKCAKVGLA